MPTAATLSVKILADLGDFEKGLSKADRAVLRTADSMTEAGKKMALGITLPLVAMGAAFAKAAADQAASGAQLQRAFGDGAKAMDASIAQLMRTVPVTDNQLRGLAVSTDTLLRSMGLAAPAAQRMTTRVMQLAGDLAAYNHVEVGVAEDALEKALAGKMRSMEQFGVVISEADVKTRAYQLGIAKVGTELTHAQTAQAAWSLILEKTKQQQGEAARTIDDDANAFKRLHQAADDVAESFGAVILPAAAKATTGIADFLKTLADTPPAAKTAIVAVGGIAAAAAPAIITVGMLTRGIVDFRAAMIRLSTVETAAGVAAGTVGAGIGKVALTLGPLALLATAGALAIYDLQKAFDDADASAEEATKNTSAYVDYLKALGRAHAHAPSAKPAPTAPPLTVPKTFDDTMKAASDRTQVILDSVKQVDGKFATITGLGDAWVKQLGAVNTLLAEAERKFGRISSQYVAINQQRIDLMKPVTITPVNTTGMINTAGLNQLMNPPQNTLVGNVVQGKLPSFESFNIIPNKLDQTNEALQAGFSDVAQSIGVTLADNLGGKLASFLSARGIGLGVGGAIGGGIGSAFGGGVGSSLGTKAATEIGGVLGAGIGSVVPIAGSMLGGVIGSAIGGLFGHHKKSVDDSASALDKLAIAANVVTGTMSDLPTGFKIAFDRYSAQDKEDHSHGGSSSGPSGGDTGGGPIPGGPNPNVFNFHGPITVVANDPTSFMKQMQQTAQGNLNRGGAGLMLAGTKA